MASLFRKLFSKRGAPSAPEVHLAAFGKHPGWDDHIEDLGLETHRLVAAKRVLYTQGLAGNIDSGAWERLGDEERLEGFHHLFLWHSAYDLVLGHMWSSSDGKGRTRYPMVVCAQVSGTPLDWAFRHVLPLLEMIEARCVATASAAAVRGVLDDGRRMLRQAASGVAAAEQPVPPMPRALAYLADRPEMAPNHQGLHRVLYLIEREMASYHPEGSDAAAASTAHLRSTHMRVPACANSAQGAAALWLGFLLSRLDPAAPILLILPLGQPWVDVVVGEPGVQQFFCVRASRQALPLATDIPYTLDAAFVERAEAAIGRSREERVLLPDMVLQSGVMPHPRPPEPMPRQASREPAAPPIAPGPAPRLLPATQNVAGYGLARNGRQGRSSTGRLAGAGSFMSAAVLPPQSPKARATEGLPSFVVAS